jgi:uncharacterized protein YraI
MERGRRLPLNLRQQLALGLLAFGIIAADLSVASLPAIARAEAQPAAAITETRLRAEPTKHGSPLLRLPEGATITVHGKPKDGWYEARSGRLQGYVRSGDVATFPAAVSVAPTSPTVDESPEVSNPEATSLEQRARGSHRTHRKHDHGKHDKSSHDKGTADAHRDQKIVVAADLNLRLDASHDAPVTTVMPRGAVVRLLGDQKDGFVKVDWAGQSGWAFGKHLTAHRQKVRKDSNPGSWSREELTDIIYAAADRYGQPREDMLRVARCESDLVPTAVNARGGSYGLFQFKPGTWLSTPYGEYDIFDPRASANAAGWMWSVGRRREWVCQ